MITSKIKRPALRYYGGKWNIAPWIICHFPKHKNYVEPCGGGANVLLRKAPSPLETYNDLDGNVVNFFRVLRDQPDELIRKIQLTPWSRSEYESSLGSCQDEDEIEKARRFLISACMSFNGATGNTTRSHSWRCSLDVRLRTSPCNDLVNNDLHNIAVRLRKVQIENRDYRNIIERFDNNEALVYMDPPYLTNTRTNSKNWYALEWSEADHIEAADILQRAKGYVILSGYSSPLYTKLYEAYDWQRVDKEATTNSGGKRIESLWLSPRTWEALNEMQQGKLFPE